MWLFGLQYTEYSMLILHVSLQLTQVFVRVCVYIFSRTQYVYVHVHVHVHACPGTIFGISMLMFLVEHSMYTCTCLYSYTHMYMHRHAHDFISLLSTDVPTVTLLLAAE